MDVLGDISNATYGFVVEYRWHLFGLLLLFGAFRHRIYDYYANLRRRWDEYEYAAKYHKDSDLAKSRLDAVNQARIRMQKELEIKSAEAERIRKEKQAKADAERAAALNSTEGGYRLGSTPSASSNKLRTEYFPLMGDPRGSSYKAPKKSCCKKGGGCG